MENKPLSFSEWSAKYSEHLKKCRISSDKALDMYNSYVEDFYKDDRHLWSKGIGR